MNGTVEAAGGHGAAVRCESQRVNASVPEPPGANLEGRQVPESDHALIVGGGQCVAVGTDRQANDSTRGASQGGTLGPCGHVPQAYRGADVVAQCEQPAIGRKREAPYTCSSGW